MIVVASAQRPGWDRRAWASASRRGGTALDAVELGTAVEDDPDEHGGLWRVPKCRRHRGARCVDHGRRNPPSRRSLRAARISSGDNRRPRRDERTAHVLLAGDGAARLAARSDCTRRTCDSLGAPTTPSKVGTVDFIAIDAGGHLASAVSTSGWPGKAPGRVGDSPVIGAGNYCDDRFGAAACTGLGELAVRATTARMVVAALEQGVSVGDACLRAMADLPEPGVMNIVAVDRAGNHYGVTNSGDPATYVVRTDGMTQHEELPRVHASR